MHAEAAKHCHSEPPRDGADLSPQFAESGNIYTVALRPHWAGFELATFGL
jgi:hypothetical protein